MPALVGYLLLFLVVGVGFILVHLLAGKLIRPAKPSHEKLTIYECGEPTIGSAWVQFDVRYYVVALLFVIFDVEVAFFFPWAVVFGKLADLAKPGLPPAERVALTVGTDPARPGQPLVAPYPEAKGPSNEFRTTLLNDPKAESRLAQELIASNRSAAYHMGWIALVDIAVFFGVLLVGFAYLWKRGDLSWVRSTAAEEPPQPAVPPAPVLTGATAAVTSS
jgi:NADH-quinone oxidoreductase subunit A